MYPLIGTVRIFLLVVITFVGLIAGVLSMVLPARIISRLATIWHGSVIKAVGVECCFKGVAMSPGILLVSNHISWLDISVIGSRFPVVFLAKSEIASWPILGWMIRKAGTLFIERGKGSEGAVKKIAEVLGRNQAVLIFPEGKTTDGLSVIRFQPRLFQSAVESGSVVQPVAIRYVNNDGVRVVRMSFHGEIGFLESLWRTVCGGVIHAEIYVFDPIKPGTDRNLISRCAEDCVREWVNSV